MYCFFLFCRSWSFTVTKTRIKFIFRNWQHFFNWQYTTQLPNAYYCKRLLGIFIILGRDFVSSFSVCKAKTWEVNFSTSNIYISILKLRFPHSSSPCRSQFWRDCDLLKDPVRGKCFSIKHFSYESVIPLQKCDNSPNEALPSMIDKV